FSVIALLIAPFGAVVIGGHQVAYTLATPVYLISVSLGTALTIRVSSHLGEGCTAGASFTIRVGLTLACLSAVCTAALTGFARFNISGLFTADPEVHALASRLLLFCALYQIPDSLQVVLGAGLRGYQDNGTLLKGGLAAHWLVGFPVGYALVHYSELHQR